MPGLLCGELGGDLCPPRIESTSLCLASFGHKEPGTTEIHQRIIELHDSLRPPLHAYLSCLGVSSEQAEDIIQETFLRLARHLQGRCGDHNLRAWTFRVAHNLSMDHHRSQQRWSLINDGESHPAIRERVDSGPNPEQQLILAERRKRLGNALALLTPKQRHCVLLRSKGLRYREIAPILGITIQRVGELMQRAITVLAAGM